MDSRTGEEAMKDYSYLFDGSKLYCYFTEEEKQIYQSEMRQRVKRMMLKNAIMYFIVYFALGFSIMALIMQVLK